MVNFTGILHRSASNDEQWLVGVPASTQPGTIRREDGRVTMYHSASEVRRKSQGKHRITCSDLLAAAAPRSCRRAGGSSTAASIR